LSLKQRPSRLVVSTARPKTIRSAPLRQQPRESIVAIALILAAALATFAALLITSRPYDPMNSTIAPQANVPPAPIPMGASPKASPTVAASPAEVEEPRAEQPQAASAESSQVDDAEVKSAIEQVFASDPALADVDVNLIVENGRVTLSGAVNSAEIKQKAERAVRSVKGVTGVNNQLVIIQATPE
jgi:BON domain